MVSFYMVSFYMVSFYMVSLEFRIPSLYEPCYATLIFFLSRLNPSS